MSPFSTLSEASALLAATDASYWVLMKSSATAFTDLRRRNAVPWRMYLSIASRKRLLYSYRRCQYAIPYGDIKNGVHTFGDVTVGRFRPPPAKPRSRKLSVASRKCVRSVPYL